MEYTSEGVPVVLNATRPARGRHRGYSEHPNGHQPLYYQGTNALLMPADAGALMPTHHRSASVAVPGRPTSVIINNSQYDDYSPVRGSHHRHSSYGHDYYHHGDDDYEYPVHSPHWRGRAHSHAHSRSPSPFDPEMDRKLQKLADLEKKEEEEEARLRFEEEMILKQARKEKKKKQEEALKKAWLEDQKVKELEEKEKAKKKKTEEDEKFRKRALETFGKAGYDEEYVEKIIKKAEKKEKKEGHEHGGHKGGKKMLDLARPTHIRVDRKYLEPETLELYDVPWDWDAKDDKFIIIKKWIPEHEQNVLFDHTRSLREQKRLKDTSVELEKRRGELRLVERRRSPSRARSRSRARSYMFT